VTWWVARFDSSGDHTGTNHGAVQRLAWCLAGQAELPTLAASLTAATPPSSDGDSYASSDGDPSRKVKPQDSPGN
jgi:hypothetical protein